MNDEFKKLFEFSREIEKAGNPLKDLQETLRVVRALRPGADMQTMVRELTSRSTKATRMFAELRQTLGGSDAISERVRGLSGAVAKIDQANWKTDALAIREQYAQFSDQLRDLQQQFLLPDTQAISGAVADLKLINSTIAELGGAKTVESRMAAMRLGWVDIHNHMRSFQSFIDLQEVGRLSTSALSFSADVSSRLRLELGDWRDPITFNVAALKTAAGRLALYDSRGFNSHLTHFSEPAYHEAVVIAGLAVEEDELLEDDDDDFVELNSSAYRTLIRFEREMRAFIVTVMRGTFGDQWMNQLPPLVRDDWHAKREKARAAGAVDIPLIDYADFTHYKLIIEKSDNWTKVFKPIFGRKEDVQESFQRLFPVRLATMHSRFITLDDDLLLRSETTRLINTIRRHC